MKKTYIKLAILLASFIPVLALAQAGQAIGTLDDIIGQIAGIVQKLIPIAFGLAILGFFWGLAKYIFSAGNEESKVEGKKIMLYGLVAIFVMASVFGIVRLAQRTLGIDDRANINVPNVTIPRN